MSSEEDKSDAPHPIRSRPIVEIYIDDFVVQNLFADTASRIDFPLLRTARRQPTSTHLEFSAHAHLAEAFHSLRIAGSHGQRTLDIIPVSEKNVTVLAPALEAPDLRFFALGFSQNNKTV